MTQQELTIFFKQHYKQEPKFFYQAPGRVNLMGEHSDYNGGFVLPCAINAYTSLALAPSPDNKFRVISTKFPSSESSWPVSLKQSHDQESSWANYLRGLTAEFVKAGYFIKPMSIAIKSDVPMGCGLSSSAALQMSFATALNEINKLGLQPLQLASLAKDSENNFVGSQCGIMDQLVSGTARKDFASLIDCEKLTWDYIPIDPRWKILVINSGIQRTLTGSAFNTRVEECAKIRSIIPERLRSLRLSKLESYRSQLGETLFRRARHVVSDNHRVSLLAEALKNYDLKAAAILMKDSHKSMDEDFAMTIPEINAIFHLVNKELSGEGGVRLTGGGWGGALVVLTSQAKVARLRDLIVEYYNLNKKIKAEFFCFETASGASSVV